MINEFKIKDILNFLKGKNFDFSFQGNENDSINGFSTLFNYKVETITFISTLYSFKDYKHLFKTKKIRLILTDPSEKVFGCFENIIHVKKPTNAFFSILEHFFGERSNYSEQLITNDSSLYPRQSFISKKALIGKNVKIGIGCVIDEGVIIGDNTEIHHNVVIKSGTKIGRNCTVFSGAVIGERGFNPSTLRDGSRKMLSHFGGVTIEDNVHIGVNCSIHKGSIDDTVIREGVKLNTMVHVAHNCIIGENTVVTMPTQICGSVKIGKNCHVAATTIRNQCEIGDNAVLGLGSVVVKDVGAGMTVVGNPAKPLQK
ncbi:hypothetical protein MUB24_07045 [Lederbergia sp. NSJ-179]|uniref:UDP-3-O-(3-hydroxymyristoyl)glucosamine N-acyltransferase n=1 Tax=Lederbergia sp. NSJ-179 TaxID=2931402 RepID=UPI001FD2C5D4|nr:UDP-3-O-(3-hydroxymyristoyl)glucosamine N-acyltransferase [Lederbergia sp. NSJ-179]MCJ7840668.1 hypothetical protein [Lederbergia sp. NSJ-179]